MCWAWKKPNSNWLQHWWYLWCKCYSKLMIQLASQGVVGHSLAEFYRQKNNPFLMPSRDPAIRLQWRFNNSPRRTHLSWALKIVALKNIGFCFWSKGKVCFHANSLLFQCFDTHLIVWNGFKFCNKSAKLFKNKRIPFTKEKERGWKKSRFHAVVSNSEDKSDVTNHKWKKDCIIGPNRHIID